MHYVQVVCHKHFVAAVAAVVEWLLLLLLLPPHTFDWLDRKLDQNQMDLPKNWMIVVVVVVAVVAVVVLFVFFFFLYHFVYVLDDCHSCIVATFVDCHHATYWNIVAVPALIHLLLMLLISGH